MPSSASVCPVPTEQQPINEYQELKESWFFRWATLELQGFIKPIVILWTLSWLVAGPVAATSFHVTQHPAQFLIFGAAGSMVIPLLALLRLYLGWVYVCDRLSKATIFYEESGWYDGQEWTKPEEVVQRDNLIVNYQLKSVLQRLKMTFGAILALFILGGVLWMFL